MSNKSIFTIREQTVKRFTINDAIENAKMRISGKICLDTIGHRSYDEKITLVELNDISSAIVYDTMYWRQ